MGEGLHTRTAAPRMPGQDARWARGSVWARGSTREQPAGTGCEVGEGLHHANYVRLHAKRTARQPGMELRSTGKRT